MGIRSAPVMAFRWTTFLLAGGYCLVVLLGPDQAGPGGPVRFLSIWALFLSFYAASRMLALSEGRITRRHRRTAAVAAVVNAMVLLASWNLLVTDPALVDRAEQAPWHQHYYLHALGPALQIFDALFIARVFRRPWRAVPPLLAFLGAYVLSVEVLLTRSDIPTASTWGDRLAAHAACLLLAILILAGFALLGRLIRHRSEPLPPQPAPQ